MSFTRQTMNFYWTLCIVLVILFTFRGVSAIVLQGSETSYARYPPWVGCTNDSFSFEFKSEQQEGLLWYVDDGGTYDFFEIMLTGGRVRLVMNIVDGRDGNVEITVGQGLNDGKWHRVEVRRRRMETFLKVDGSSDSKFSFGSDFYFGRGKNSHVYIGGLPTEFNQMLDRLALPSALFQRRYKGSIRNVFYGNCTCQSHRATMIDSIGVNTFPPESCELRNPCQTGCVCVSTDASEPTCDCSERHCVTGTLNHYELPMDRVSGTTLVNPSGLDATAFGNPTLARGIRGNAIQTNGREKYIRVSGPGHRFECFGDLDKCSNGYTLSFWANFATPPRDGDFVYLSNGGHSARSHGIAAVYNRGKLEFVFKRKNGQEWRASAGNILPGRWYHVAASWSQRDGLSLYINGDLITTTLTASRGQAVAENSTYANDFIIGKANDALSSTSNQEHSMWIDDFNFWSFYKNATDIRENGPFYRYILSMDSRQDVDLGGTRFSVHGNPTEVMGKIGKALQFDGRQDYMSGGDQSISCFGNLTKCLYGITTGMWIKFNDLRESSYILSTGKNGIELYYKDGRLTAEVQQGTKNWKASWSKPETGRWYFLELTWNPDDGLKMFADLQEVAEASAFQRRDPDADGARNLFIGRSNSDRDRYSAVTVDNLELWYGDRQRLIDFDFIQRGKPPNENFGMDRIDGNRIYHPNIRIETFGNPRIVPGRIGGALNLDGSNEFVSLGRQQDSCLGNLDLCRHGLLLSMWLKPGQLQEGMDLMSSGTNGLRAWYENGRLKVSARTLTQEWSLQTDRVKPDEWQFIEIAWDPKTGLAFYVNEELVARETRSSERRDFPTRDPSREQFYIGRGDGTRSNARFGDFTLDDMEHWTSNREYLLAFDYIQRGKPDHILINMDSIRSGQIVHPSLTIPVHGSPVTVPGKVNNAIRFDGNGQYADVGDQKDNCFGNMRLCKHGITGSMLLNFRDFQDDMYYMTSGGGLRLYYANGKLYASIDKSGQRWEVGVPNLQKDKWYFVEYTWHPEKGLQLYIDNKLVGETKLPIRVTEKPLSGNMLIGSANRGDTDTGRFRYTNALVDEVETWQSNREKLIAYDYIIRDNVPQLVFPLEQRQGNRVIHPGYNILLHNGASLVPAAVGNGALMEGEGQYLSFGDQRGSCMGNLEKCKHGMTVSFFINPKRILDNAYYLSGGPYSVYSKDGKFYAKFSTSNKTWEVSTDRITANNWQKVELSWDEERGLEFYVDKEKVASTTQFRTHSPLRISDYTVYLGRPNEEIPNARYADATIDQLEYWFANRDLLKKFNLIGEEINHIIIDMDRITSDILVHPKKVIYVSGNPSNQPGLIGNAVTLNGRNQFIDVGQDAVCSGKLENCPKGFTLRFKIKPDQLLDNTYFISSSPVNVYYKDNRLVAEVRTPDKVWTASTPNLSRDSWNQVDLSWHPADGLVLLVNNEVLDRQVSGYSNNERYDDTKHFYVGRASTNMIQERFASATFDDLQIWEAKRDYLIPNLINPGKDNELIFGQPTRRTPAPTATRRPWSIPTPGPGKWLIFDGRSWIQYDFSQLPDDYLRKNAWETLNIRFKTDAKDGLLWYTGNNNNNAHLTIKDGILYLISNTTTGNTVYRDVFQVQIPSGRLDDNKWHDVYITKQEREVRMVVDGHEFRKRFVSDVDLISPNYVYLGGSNNTWYLTNQHISTNFKGTVETAVMNGDTLPQELDLINLFLIRPRPPYIFVDGNVVVVDPDHRPTTPRVAPDTQAVTFMTESAYMRLPRWDALRAGSIEFYFRTLEPNGLIVFSGGRPDSFGIEIFDGKPVVYLDLGGGVHRYPFEMRSGGSVNDGQPHHIVVNRRGNQLRLTLDGESRTHTIIGGDDNLDLNTDLYVGGVDNPNLIPWHFWSKDRKFFRGCVWGMRINDGELIDLHSYVNNQLLPGIELGCRSVSLQCQSSRCANGLCLERTDGRICDCSATAFTGDRCQNAAPIAGFSGKEFVRVNFRNTQETHTNDISFRFKTPKENGLLFITSARGTDGYLKVFLDRGEGKVETNIGGQREQVVFRCDEPLNDDKWHTVHIKRRADSLEAYVDDCIPGSTDLSGSGYTLDIDEVLIARQGQNDPRGNAFIGHLQNFYFDGLKFVEIIGGDHDQNIYVDKYLNVTTSETLLVIYPVTFREHQDSFVSLPSLEILGDAVIKLMIKTTEKNGLLLYNGGTEDNFFALELVNGILHVSGNDGSGPRVVTVPASSLADDRWHSIEIKQTDLQTFSIVVDQQFPAELKFPSSRRSFDLTDRLYVGGVPSTWWSRLPNVVTSKKGFSGCMSSFIINGHLYNLMTGGIGASSQHITEECRRIDSVKYCTDNICLYNGICSEGLNTYICDCNMTSRIGQQCADEAKGYRFGFENKPGITVFTLTPPESTDGDRLAFGFMTWYPNGTLVRIESVNNAEFIDAKLVDGHVVFTYNIGDGVQTISETRRKFNDGQYHYVTFVRRGGNVTMTVDDFPAQTYITQRPTTTKFDDMHLVKIGGNTDHKNDIIDYFNGIIAGVYLNSYRIIDLGVLHNDGRVRWRDDTIVASHPFFLPKPIPPTPPPVTQAPPPPPVLNGGGAVWDETVMVVDPPLPGEPNALPVVGSPVQGGTGEGARAAAVAGAMLGILAAVSSIVWALYKFKPGLIGGGGGGPGGILSISSPVAGANYQPVNMQDTPLVKVKTGGGTGFTGATSGKKSESTSFIMTKTDAANGMAGTGAAIATSHMGTQTAESGSADFSDYYAFSSSQASSGMASSTAVAGHRPGTTTRAIQTDLAYMAPGGAGYGSTMHTTTRNTTITNVYNSQQMGGGGAGGYGAGYQSQNMMAGQGYGQGYGDAFSSSTHTYDASRSYAGGQEFYSQMDGGGYGGTAGRTISPPPTDPNSLYQMRNMTLNYSAFNQQNMYGQQMQGGGGAVTMATPNLMSEEIRVDCVQMTNNGRYVVTGSIYGPPQVWDMKTGELVRIMQGDDFSSTDLHLANGDTLLVGQVAELEQVDSSNFSSNVHFRKLQIWDFNTGQPLEMRKNELCTASCLMGDGERMVLGRTEKFGGGTTIIIWDVLGNEPLRHIKYNSSVGLADPITYLNLSKDNRYVIAGFQNSYDQNANFISFDLTVNDFNAIPPKVIALNAQAEVTAILENQEVVTGTRAGELIIWSMRTGKPLRQLVSPSRDIFSQTAHQREVTDVCVSKDNQYLVSASADMTLKVWGLESEKLLRTLTGHKDEVNCCTVSNDNELIVSGSRDCTIRLWRLEDGVPVAAINAGIDVFKVLLSNNKKTVVALADKHGARKLVMLQVVRTKVRSAAGSRATSPFVSDDYNRY